MHLKKNNDGKSDSKASNTFRYLGFAAFKKCEFS